MKAVLCFNLDTDERQRHYTQTRPERTWWIQRNLNTRTCYRLKRYAVSCYNMFPPSENRTVRETYEFEMRAPEYFVGRLPRFMTIWTDVNTTLFRPFPAGCARADMIEYHVVWSTQRSVSSLHSENSKYSNTFHASLRKAKFRRKRAGTTAKHADLPKVNDFPTTCHLCWTAQLRVWSDCTSFRPHWHHWL